MLTKSPFKKELVGLKLFLRAHPRFAGWSDRTVERLQSGAVAVSLPARSLVQHAGTDASAVFVLASGVVEAVTSLNTGDEHLLAFLHPGSLLGLTAAFLQEPPLRRQNWLAHSPVFLWRVPVEDFRDCFFEDRAMAATVLDSMASRIQWLMDEVAAAALLPAQAKVIRCLLGMHEPPEPKLAGRASVLKMTHAKLAQMLGLTRQSVAVVLKDLEARQLIRVERYHIEVLAKSALAEFGAECGAAVWRR